MADFPYKALTFDCFGTLMDWRRGQRECLESLPSLEGGDFQAASLDRARMEEEARLQAGPWRPYRQILETSLLRAMKQTTDCTLSLADAQRFGGSMGEWPAYPDSQAALGRLNSHFTLGLLSNADEVDLQNAAKIGLGMIDPLLISSEAVRSYKPDPGHWQAALRRLDCSPTEILHVSAYSYYDLTPAHHLGFALAFLARDEEQAPVQLPLAYQARDLADLADQLGC
ncbi:MAG: HAD-IA family hydrolase [Planctomycetota bacterium]|jgi:2-haloalkanoic acid dehalogenase type II